MQLELVVVRAFAGRVCGEVVRAAKDIATVLAGEHAHHVVQVKKPDVSAAQPVVQPVVQETPAAPAASASVKTGS
jgi:hypothetical protein